MTPASVSSQTLESSYLADKNAQIPFSAGQHQYVLSFDSAGQRMYQQNVRHATKREVKRRPRFVSSQDVKEKLERYFGMCIMHEYVSDSDIDV